MQNIQMKGEHRQKRYQIILLGNNILTENHVNTKDTFLRRKLLHNFLMFFDELVGNFRF